jgi:hypothetical protein
VQLGTGTDWASASFHRHYPGRIAIKADGSLWICGWGILGWAHRYSETFIRVGTDNNWSAAAAVDFDGTSTAINTDDELWRVERSRQHEIRMTNMMTGEYWVQELEELSGLTSPHP